MKRMVLLISLMATLTLCASAQTYIDFHQMPWANAPTKMPDIYPAEFNLNWDNFYYVTPGLWAGGGPGFLVDPAVQHNTVAFVGGPFCVSANVCHGSIKMVGANANANFQPISISLTAGWAANTLSVTAYNRSEFVGNVVWKLTTSPQLFKFPPAWTNVTELVFAPNIIKTNLIQPLPGSMVIYSFLSVQHQ
jgi:hypothetical protein